MPVEEVKFLNPHDQVKEQYTVSLKNSYLSQIINCDYDSPLGELLSYIYPARGIGIRVLKVIVWMTKSGQLG